MEIKKLKDMLRPSVIYQVELGKRLGEGTQGQVFLLSRFNALHGSYVLKLYDATEASEEGHHLVAFVHYLESKPQLRNHPGLALPLYAILDEQSGRVGCVTPLARGQSIETRVYSRLYRDNGLGGRIQAAIRAADAVSALHQSRIVAADINESNMLYDPGSGSSTFYDIDGGGVLVSDLGDAYLPNLAPLIRGRFESNFLAPELLENPGKMPSQLSDRWSLAVLLHKFLLGGLDPYFGMPYLEIVKHPMAWPTNFSDPKLARWVAFQQSELKRLGNLLLYRLHSVFDRRLRGGWHCDIRPKAEDWLRDLRVAAGWIHRCCNCGQDFVSERLSACPFCNTGGLHFTIQTTRINFSLDQDGMSLSAREVGFTDLVGRYPLATFHRQGRNLLVIAQTPLQELRTRHQIAPNETILLEAGTTAWGFRAWSRDNKSQAEFRVSPPQPKLGKSVVLHQVHGKSINGFPTAA